MCHNVDHKDFEKELGKLTKEETADRILGMILHREGKLKDILTIDIGNTNCIGLYYGEIKNSFCRTLVNCRTKSRVRVCNRLFKNVLDIYHIHRDRNRKDGAHFFCRCRRLQTIVKLAGREDPEEECSCCGSRN